MTLDLSPCKLPPYAHQVVGIQKLVSQPYVFLGDEMGMGKCLQTIVAAQLLFQQGTIDNLIVIAPACVKSVWVDETLGELKKHLFDSTPVLVTEFHAKSTAWSQGPESTRKLRIWVTNYEFLVSNNRVTQLLPACGPKTLLVLDESSYVKSHSAQRTKACLILRRACGRVALLNGTPIANNPLDLFSQANMMHPSVLDCKYVTHFRARYEIRTPVKRHNGTVMIGPYGKPIMQNAGWTNLDDLSKRLAPYMLRRLKADTLDLPAKLPPVTVTVPLVASWPHYKAMRDEMVIWLQSSDVATAQTAAVKAMRLAQITSGFVGGIEASGIGESDDVMIPGVTHDIDGERWPQASGSIQEVGREKLDAFLDWLALALEEDPNLKLLVQCRFRAEIARLTNELRQRYPAMHVGEIIGGQKKQERTDALHLLDPRTTPAGPVTVTMSSAGSLGLNLTASHTVVRLSRDYSLWLWLQGEDRVHRPGQTSPVSYVDFVARGPKGQRTVDHLVLEALIAKQDVAQLTSAAWVKALTAE
jgi:SNF2 family DNA or RNA helicase